jgi:hypothetical protein
MSAYEQFNMIGLKAGRTLHSLLAVPANFYSIAFGLVGLARVWHLASSLYGLSVGIGDALFLVAAVVFLLLFAVLMIKLVLAPKTVLADLTDPAIGPFFSLLPITGMLLAVGLELYALEAARVLFLVFFVAMLLLGGWYTGRWIVTALDVDTFSPGYFLPRTGLDELRYRDNLLVDDRSDHLQPAVLPPRASCGTHAHAGDRDRTAGDSG